MNAKINAIAGYSLPDPAIPLQNRVQEDIIQDYLTHPTDRQEIICARHERNPCYLHKILRAPEVKARIDYLKKTTFKEKEKSLIWTQEQIISNVQKRLTKIKSDMAYLRGHEMLARWKGMDKITTTVKTETNQPIQVIPIQVIFQEIATKTTNQQGASAS